MQPSRNARPRFRRCRRIRTAIALLGAATGVGAEQVDIAGPVGSGAFGTRVVVLPNGNVVVTDPLYANRGAVHLYTPDGVRLSTLTGNSDGDAVGSGGVTVLANGHFVVASPLWRNADAGVAQVGAVTWVDGTTGLDGAVTAANSLIGTTFNDQVGRTGVVALTNGHYVVRSSIWDNAGVVDAGAVTWANGTTGLVGVVSPVNSLVGTTGGDNVGVTGVTALTNGHYVVGSHLWNGPGNVGDVGAATWGNGGVGVAGAVSAANSLVGTTPADFVGLGGVAALSNGHYVVASYAWDNGGVPDVGAATWANGTTGLVGPVSPANSLIGTADGDQVSVVGVTPLTNGHYVVASPFWNNGATLNVGAATWANGSTGLVGTVSAANSLIGAILNDQVGLDGVTALTNGNYVVASSPWDNGVGPESSAVGAVTWANGATGRVGTVTAGNSLIGPGLNDQVGIDGVFALANGHYVVASSPWRNPATEVPSVGAVTWANGSTGLVGTVTAANSLIGSVLGDLVGSNGVLALGNGNYVVPSPNWSNGGSADVGAVTWAVGSTGRTGAVASVNSLIGSTSNDQVGKHELTAFGDGAYAVRSAEWDNAGIANAGAVTLGPGSYALTGRVDATNSVLGTVANGGFSMTYAYDAARQQLVVGRPASNLVTLFRTDRTFADGFE